MSSKAKVEHWLHRQWSKRGLFSLLLRPLSWLATYYVQRKSSQPRTTLNITPPPIIVVGNIIVGGTGKTPVVLALCDFLQTQGWKPGIISRGYGVDIKNSPARVGQGQLSATEFGDEPTLLAQKSGVPIAVHPKRVQALEALLTKHPEINVVIADDGLQHQALCRDLEIIVQDARGMANGLVLPAGPLREPPAKLSKADWLITQLAPGQSLPNTPRPTQASRCVTMRLAPLQFEQLSTGQTLAPHAWLERYQNQACIAIAAIGQPTRFFSMLTQFGIHLKQSIGLADHGLLNMASFTQLDAQCLLITAKDAVKYPTVNDSRIWVVHVSPQFTPSRWLFELEHQLQHVLQQR